MPSSHLTTSSMLAQQINSSLHKKVWRLGQQNAGSSRAVIFLQDGSASIETAEQTFALNAPVLMWLNQPSGNRLIADAGTTGHLMEIADDIVTRAVGDFSESAILHFMVEQNSQLVIPISSKDFNSISDSFAAILSELQTPKSGSDMMVVAFLRIILVSMMRLSGAEEPQQASSGSGAHYLQRFRQLVESNFRAHWPISRYAEMLGISHDRLHAISQRELNKTPKALVAERLAREAGMGLERSTLTIEQLGYSLGFRDPAHFSHFFKRMTGMSPGKFRRIMASSVPGSSNSSPANFADWP